MNSTSTGKSFSRFFFAVAAAASIVVSARGASVSAALDGDSFAVSFADHANVTNSLWVAYGPGDMGGGTNGWAHVERLGTVLPETDSWSYPASSSPKFPTTTTIRLAISAQALPSVSS